MGLLGLDMLILLGLPMAILIWLGIWRSWAYKDHSYREYPLGFPWFILGFLIVRILIVMRTLGINLPGEFAAIALCTCLVIGLSAIHLQWPSWTLPPWYRELADDEEEPQS